MTSDFNGMSPDTEQPEIPLFSRRYEVTITHTQPFSLTEDEIQAVCTELWGRTPAHAEDGDVTVKELTS